MHGNTFDVVVAGGGVVGCSLVRALRQRDSRLKVCLLEKETTLGAHQSGRNSGVAHVGYNQKPGTLKAKFVVEGSRRLREFCRERNVPFVKNGILVVARTEADVETLKILLERGRANGAEVTLVDEQDVRAHEPLVLGIAALWAPEGASFDARAYVARLAQEAQAAGVEIALCEAVTKLYEKAAYLEIKTTIRTIRARVFVNAAGLYADRLAAQLISDAANYQIIPFRGEYSELVPEKRELVRSHIYACPDLNFPFLGVHLSKTFDGRVLVGPGAVLALGREAYEKFGFSPSDTGKMLLYPGFWRMATSRSFISLARKEFKKSLFRSAVVKEAKNLIPTLTRRDILPSRAGIRAQLVAHNGTMTDDLTVKETPRSLHVLNAVSPALTCSLPFADYLAEQVEAKLNQ